MKKSSFFIAVFVAIAFPMSSVVMAAGEHGGSTMKEHGGSAMHEHGGSTMEEHGGSAMHDHDSDVALLEAAADELMFSNPELADELRDLALRMTQ